MSACIYSINIYVDVTALTYMEAGEICIRLVLAQSVSCDVAALVSHGLSGYYIHSQHLAGFESVLGSGCGCCCCCGCVSGCGSEAGV